MREKCKHQKFSEGLIQYPAENQEGAQVAPRDQYCSRDDCRTEGNRKA